MIITNVILIRRYEYIMTRHELKTLPAYFEMAWYRTKQFELRKNDRNFQIGDEVILREWSPNDGYSGRSILSHISCIISEPEYLADGYVALGLSGMVNWDVIA